MTKRTPSGYQHPNAYRSWLEEHDTLLRTVACKGLDTTALNQVVSAETLAVCLGRSATSIVRRGEKLGVHIMTNDELKGAFDDIQREAQEFVDKYI